MKRLVIILAALLVPLAANAQDVETTGEAASENPRLLGIPMESIELGGGWLNYTGEPADQIAPGPAWALRATLDASRPVDVELGYAGGFGSLYDIPGAPDDPFNIYSNGLQANAKINPFTFVEDIVPMTPFVLAGIGIDRLSVAQDPRLATEFRSDTMGTVPLAAGVDVDVTDTVRLSGRGQYDLFIDNEIIPTEDSTSSDRLTFTLNLGVTQF